MYRQYDEATARPSIGNGTALPSSYKIPSDPIKFRAPSEPRTPRRASSFDPPSQPKIKKTVALPYRSFLTPSRHARFVRAMGMSFVGCYLASMTMLRISWWSFMPFRALVLFTPVFAVFMVRLTRAHIGRRVSQTAIGELTFTFGKLNSVIALFWFAFAYSFYAEVYMAITGADGEFDWVEYGRPHQRPWVNERAVIMRATFLVMGLTKALRHLYLDLDRIPFPVRKFDQGKVLGLGTPTQRIRQSLYTEAKASIGASLVICAISIVTYFLFIRQISSQLSLALIHNFLSLSPVNRPGRIATLAACLLRHGLIQSILCGLMLDFAQLCFTAYSVQPPFKTDSKFLTAGSDDPNRSLINGLISRNELQRTSSFYELGTIAHTVGRRRKTIFTELVDKNKKRKEATWVQISNICLAEVTQISQRINFARAKGVAPVVLGEPPEKEEEETSEYPTYKMIGTKKMPIIQPAPYGSLFEATVDAVRKYNAEDLVSPEESPPDFASSVYSAVGSLVKKATQKEAGSVNVSQYWNLWVDNYPGALFFHQPARMVTSVVCSAPYSEGGVISDAIDSLVQLSISSITDDDYGRVFDSIPDIIRTIAQVLIDLESFIADVIPDSTTEDDQRYMPRGLDGELSHSYHPVVFRPKVLSDPFLEDVLAIRAALRDGLDRLKDSFAPHWKGLKMKRLELNDLERLVGKPVAVAVSGPV